MSDDDNKAQKQAALGGGPYRGNDLFRRIATRTAHGVGSPWAFAIAAAVVIAWGCLGPVFGFSDTWQLVINTGTTIVTFLMVFLIQNTQNRDGHAIQLKLDELIRANKSARNRLMALEELTDQEMDEVQKEFDRLAREKIAARNDDSAAHGTSPRPRHKPPTARVHRPHR
jgi:low affinity Fe/Cu permease